MLENSPVRSAELSYLHTNVACKVNVWTPVWFTHHGHDSNLEEAKLHIGKIIVIASVFKKVKCISEGFIYICICERLFKDVFCLVCHREYVT